MPPSAAASSFWSKATDLSKIRRRSTRLNDIICRWHYWLWQIIVGPSMSEHQTVTTVSKENREPLWHWTVIAGKEWPSSEPCHTVTTQGFYFMFRVYSFVPCIVFQTWRKMNSCLNVFTCILNYVQWQTVSKNYITWSKLVQIFYKDLRSHGECMT